ncbi:MAG: T9SS type B sorting domain-containing protein [Bacteroidia bacterium]
MKNIFTRSFTVIAFLAINLFLPSAKAQCLQIESIMVDACVPGGACNNTPTDSLNCEGINELVLFKVGASPLSIAMSTTVAAAAPGGAGLIPVWPSNSFKGWAQNANTASHTQRINNTIVKCGYLKEPVGGVIPANAQVIIFTSEYFDVGSNSFANLQDTLYALYQTAGNFQGHFANTDNSTSSCGSGASGTSVPTGSVSVRNFKLEYPASSCTVTVSYDRSLLVNQNMGINPNIYGGEVCKNDGSTVMYDAFGTATYTNPGCQAPYIPTTVVATAPSTVCVNGTTNLTGEISGSAVTYTWATSGTGTVSVPTGTLTGSGTTTLTPTYTPGAGESGSVTFTLTAMGKCSLAVTTNTVSINVIALPSPTVASSAGAAICNGSSTTLSVNSESGVTYSWNPGAGSGTSFSVSPTSQTVYTLTATNACAAINATYTVNVNSLPTISIASASVCPGATATLTATGASTYTWNTTDVSNTISASPANTTTYSAAGTDGNGCVGVGTGTITIYNTPTVTVNSPATCIGGTVTLNANGASTYTWSTAENGNSISVNPSTSTDYTVTGTDANGCENLAVASVTINPLPTIISNSVAICPGATATLTANGASTYTWNTSATGATITDNPMVNTNYTVTGTDANGCINTATTTIAVVNTLTVTATPSVTTICNGSSATITGGGASSYTWTPSSSLSSGNGTSVSASPTVMTTYTVVGSSGSCKDSTTFTVNVNTLPNVTAATTATTVCSGISVTLNGGGAQTYTWSNGVTDGIAFTPSTTQTYTVNGTDANGCVNSATVSVSVTNLTITATSSTPSVCIGSSATLTAMGATNYTWSPSSTLSSANGSTVTATPTSTVPVTYTVVGTAGTCSASTTVSFSVNTPPVITASASATSVCQGGTVTVNASGALVYVWTGGVSNGVPFTPSSTQTYSVVGIDFSGCASNMASVTVSVTPSPTISVTPSQTVCAGQTATMTATGATTYTWSTNENGPSITINTMFVGSMIYTVQGTNGTGCPSNIASTTVTTIPISTITVTSAAVCPGATATLTASGATSYTWSPATGLSTTTGSVVTATTANTTTYVVTGNFGACSAISDTSTVTVNPSPTITVTPSQNACAGNPVSLTAGGAATYTWMPGNSHSSTLVVTPGSSTSYTVNGTSAAGCVGSSTVTSVNVNPTPTVSFVPDPSGGQAPLAVNFTNTSNGNGPLSSYWSFGNGDTSTFTSPHETFINSGSYPVILVVTDVNGCKDTAMTTIIVTDAPVVIIIPNVFTPNGDSINDVFSITGVGISKINCKIYDRWGVFLYEWSDLHGGWDGKNVSNGKEVTDGTYYFILSYSDIKSKSYNRQGYLQLIR